MKKLLLSSLAGAVICASCAGVKTAQNAQQNRAEYLKLKGDWQITSVDYDKSFRVKPFDEGADAQCFVGSTWHLVPNNYTGSYSLNGGGDCPSVKQNIKFEILNGSEFQFKKVADGTKAKTVTAGYTLNLVDQTADSFALEQSVAYNGDVVKVRYNFTKTSK